MTPISCSEAILVFSRARDRRSLAVVRGQVGPTGDIVDRSVSRLLRLLEVYRGGAFGILGWVRDAGVLRLLADSSLPLVLAVAAGEGERAVGHLAAEVLPSTFRAATPPRLLYSRNDERVPLGVARVMDRHRSVCTAAHFAAQEVIGRGPPASPSPPWHSAPPLG